MTGEFADLDTRLWAVMAPYRDRLEEGSVYGLVTLRRPVAGLHGPCVARRAVAGAKLRRVHRRPCLTATGDVVVYDNDADRPRGRSPRRPKP